MPAPVLVDVARRAAARRWRTDRCGRGARGSPLVEKLLRPVIFSKARARVLREDATATTRRRCAAIDVVEKGTATRLAGGPEAGGAGASASCPSPTCRARWCPIFFATQEIKKDAGYPEGTQAREVRKLGVVGRGAHGRGHRRAAAPRPACPCASRTRRLRGPGPRPALRARGVRRAAQAAEPDGARGRGSAWTASRATPRLLAASAVPTSSSRRSSRTSTSSARCWPRWRRPRARTASSPATPPRCPSARSRSDAGGPSRVLGMHFFSPVQKMPLLEVDRHPADGRLGHRHRGGVRAPAGQARDRGARRPRLLHHARARALHERGGAAAGGGRAPIEDVDRAMTDFGFPVGPITLLDEVGIDVGAKVAKVLHDAFGERMAPPASMARVIEDGRQGPQEQARLLHLRRTARRSAWTRPSTRCCPAAAPRRAGRAARDPGAPGLRVPERGRAAACRRASCARRATATSAPSSASASRPSWAGRSATSTTWARASRMEVLERLRAKHGDRFAPAPLLVDRAREGKTFY